MTFGFIASLTIIMIGLIFGFPGYIIRRSVLLILLLLWMTGGVATKDYVNRICQKVIKTIDSHLPCPEEVSDGADRPMDRKALWSVIHTLCVPASYFGVSFPCLKVDRAGGYAIIRSPSRAMQDFIIAPTVSIEGLESLSGMRGTYPNLWKAGWMSRDLLREAAQRDLAWNDAVLVVNSRWTRNQDHLHLHLGCIDRKLGEFISKEARRDGTNWRIVSPKATMPDIYLKFTNQEAIESDLFAMISNEIPGSENSTEWQTIALTGVDLGSKHGFALMMTLSPEPAERFLARAC
jgi:CDP-diacylglycerol pyrophosphatase